MLDEYQVFHWLRYPKRNLANSIGELLCVCLSMQQNLSLACCTGSARSSDSGETIIDEVACEERCRDLKCHVNDQMNDSRKGGKM